MSQTLGGWNRRIFLGQAVLLAVVVAVSYVTRAAVQAAVLVGLGSLVVLTALHAMGAMKQERGIVLDLSIGNACGLVSLLFFISAIAGDGSVPSVVAGGPFLALSVVMSMFATEGARTLRAPRSARESVFAALPLGVGPLYDWATRRFGTPEAS